VKNRWGSWLLLLTCCIPIFLCYPKSDQLLQDSDTAFLLKKLTEFNDPLRWFVNDWPLGNHFYRPVSTLFFEFDHRLHPGSGAGFGFTQALICWIASVSLGWMVAEFRKSMFAGIAGAWIFALWQIRDHFLASSIQNLFFYLPWVLILAWVATQFRNPKQWWSHLPTILSVFFVCGLSRAVNGRMTGDTLYWLPGRTATTMALFGFIAVAAYLRFERQSGERSAESEPSAVDLPATRTSSQVNEKKSAWGWYGVSLVSTALALGCYEQAVMIPFILIFAGFWLRQTGIQSRFAWQLPFWMLLLAYVIIRLQFVPLSPSGYQKQQFRSGPGLLLDLGDYLVPSLMPMYSSLRSVFDSFLILLTAGVWIDFTRFAANISFWWVQKKKLALPILSVAMAIFAYLPMSFLKQFGHYHYFPAGFMVLYFLVSIENLWPKIVSAVSPQAFQAPPRSHRAPGSLPRL
jgi:hypothetical protein